MSNTKANKLDRFFASTSGRKFFNRVYSWGAAIVIFGAMFKILHLPLGNEILMVGMIVEVLVFVIAGFDNSNLREDKDDIQPAGTIAVSKQGERYSDPTPVSISGRSDKDGIISPDISISTEQYVSPEYAGKMSEAARSLDDFSKTMGSLNEVSNALLDSYRQITDNSRGVSANSNNFAENMKGLNANISQLNAIYEAQLNSISDQIATVRYINESLSRIKGLYDGTVSDSAAFRIETEKMTKQIEALNQVYARLLQAMTASNNNPIVP